MSWVLLQGCAWIGLRPRHERRFPIEVPIVVPEVGQLDQFAVAIGEAHIDGPRQRLAVLPGDAAGRRPPAVPLNRARTHRVTLEGNRREAKVEVIGGCVCFQGDDFNVILIKKERCLRWFKDGRKLREKNCGKEP